MDWIDYREKLGIGLCDDEKFNYLKTRVINYFHIAEENDRIGYMETEEYIHFCNITGTLMQSPYYRDEDGYDDARFSHCFSKIKATSSLREFCAYYVALINSKKATHNSEYELTQSEIITIISMMLEESHIPFELIEANGEYFIFPKGAKELDDALVSKPLEWLIDYPATRKNYITALKQYSDGIYTRDVADNLRKTLEAFLQEFLNNAKNLETNKNKICKYLGEQGVDPGISGLFQPIINAYKNINDRTAKHNDAVDERLLEFLLYQTGILIRMVLSVKQAKNEEVNPNAD